MACQSHYLFTGRRYKASSECREYLVHLEVGTGAKVNRVNS